MYISYSIGGRFGNNLFQYFATKTLGHYSGKKYEYNLHLPNSLVIYENDFDHYYNSKSYTKWGANIYLSGYFQRDWIRHERKLVQSFFNEENKDSINNECCISDIYKAILTHYNENKEYIEGGSSDKDLTVHLRLDDFIHNNYNSEVLDTSFLIKYLSEIMKENNFERCVFVADKAKQQWEVDYMNKLKEAFPGSIIKSGNYLSDFATLYYAKNLFLCRSTFGWIASILSPHNKMTWFPEKANINSNQTLERIDDNTIIYKPDFMKL